VHFVGLYYSVEKYVRAIRATDNNKTRRTADGLGVSGNYGKSIDTYVERQLSSRTRHRVLAVVALDKSLSMV